MNRRDRENLLRNVLADEPLEALRGDSLARTLAFASARKRRRRQLRATAAGVALLAIGLIAVSTTDQTQQRAEHASATATPVDITPSAVPSPAPASARVQIITDQQLLALFPERSAALVGPVGGPRRLMLDRNGTAELH